MADKTGTGRWQTWLTAIALCVSFTSPPQAFAADSVMENLFKEVPILQYLKAVQLTGFITGYYTYNLNGASDGGPSTTARRVNDFRYNDAEANQFTLDMVELQAIKPSTEDSRAGFGVTLDYGAEIRKLQSAGLGTKDPLGFTTNAFDVRQAYLTYKAPLARGVDLKFGRFDSLIGLEVNATAYNINTSRGLLYWLTPGTHTGLLVGYPFADWLTITAGVVNGWDVADDTNDGKTLTGQITLTPTKTLSMYLSGAYGPEQGSWSLEPSDEARWIADFIAVYTPSDKLTLNLTWDAGGEKNNPFTQHNASEPVRDNYWWGVGAIAKYQVTSALSAAVRGEWVRDNGGAVLFKAFDVFPTEQPNGTRAFLDPAFRGFTQNMWEVTFTGEYKITDNLLTRLEYRHDQSSEDVFRGHADPVTNDVVDGESGQDTVSIQFTAMF